jgi:hypothetical protein
MTTAAFESDEDDNDMSHDDHVTDSKRKRAAVFDVSPEDEPKTKKRTAAFESDEEIVMMKKQCNNELTHDILNNYC